MFVSEIVIGIKPTFLFAGIVTTVATEYDAACRVELVAIEISKVLSELDRFAENTFNSREVPPSSSTPKLKSAASKDIK